MYNFGIQNSIKSRLVFAIKLKNRNQHTTQGNLYVITCGPLVTNSFAPFVCSYSAFIRHKNVVTPFLLFYSPSINCYFLQNMLNYFANRVLKQWSYSTRLVQQAQSFIPAHAFYANNVCLYQPASRTSPVSSMHPLILTATLLTASWYMYRCNQNSGKPYTYYVYALKKNYVSVLSPKTGQI